MRRQSIQTNTLQFIEKEDLMLFVNACFTCTQQQEFYESNQSQRLSIEFLHDYILGNYRQLYALTLAAGINHFNQSLIVLKLLAAGAPEASDWKIEEGDLIRNALKGLPVNRVFKLFGQLKKLRVNNRRTRAVIKEYLVSRTDPAFDAVKYRAKVKDAITHTHMNAMGELGRFLFGVKPGAPFQTPLFETYRKAEYSQKAMYALPFTVAEGFAVKHGISRAQFLKNIQSNMTQAERLRLQSSASRERNTSIEVDFKKTGLTKLSLYWLSLDEKMRAAHRTKMEQGLDHQVTRLLQGMDLGTRKIALVADRSYSMWGSYEKKQRPLAVVFGIHQLLQRANQQGLCDWYKAFWSVKPKDAMALTPYGQTSISEPFVKALSARPDLILIVSDGAENDPPGVTDQVFRAWKQNFAESDNTRVIHLNPVYNADSFTVKPLSGEMLTLGIRDAEDLPFLLNYGKFVEEHSCLADFTEYLRGKLK